MEGSLKILQMLPQNFFASAKESECYHGEDISRLVNGGVPVGPTRKVDDPVSHYCGLLRADEMLNYVYGCWRKPARHGDCAGTALSAGSAVDEE